MPATRHRPGYARSRIPARSGAVGCDRAEGGRGRQHLHFDFGRYQGLPLRHLGVELHDTMNPQKIAARVGRVNLRDTEINCIRIGGRGGLATVQRPSWGRLWPRRSRRSCSRYSPQGRLPTTTIRASGTLSLSSRSHLRSRFRVHRAYSPNAAFASTSFIPAMSARTRLLRSLSAIASAGSPQIRRPVVVAARQS